MAALCRFVGGVILFASTIALGAGEYAFAGAGAALSLVWLLAGQFAVFIERTETPPRQPPHE
jgi:hypothetical protein